MAQGLLPPGQPFCPSAQLRRLKVMDHRGSRNKDVVLLRAPPVGAARGGGRSGERNAGLRAAQGGSVNARRRCAASSTSAVTGSRGPALTRGAQQAPGLPLQPLRPRPKTPSRAQLRLVSRLHRALPPAHEEDAEPRGCWPTLTFSLHSRSRSRGGLHGLKLHSRVPGPDAPLRGGIEGWARRRGN